MEIRASHRVGFHLPLLSPVSLLFLSLLPSRPRTTPSTKILQSRDYATSTGSGRLPMGGTSSGSARPPCAPTSFLRRRQQEGTKHEKKKGRFMVYRCFEMWHRRSMPTLSLALVELRLELQPAKLVVKKARTTQHRARVYMRQLHPCLILLAISPTIVEFPEERIFCSTMTSKMCKCRSVSSSVLPPERNRAALAEWTAFRRAA